MFLFITSLPAQKLKAPSPQISADSLEILYIGNVNAAYENCLCGDRPLGGLDRVFTMVKHYRALNPSLIFIDGGDFLNSYPYDSLNKLILDIYQIMKPDVVVPADQELLIENKDIVSLLFRKNLTILGSNLNLDSEELLDSFKIKADKFRISILSYLDKSSFMMNKPLAEAQPDDRKFQKNYQRSLKFSDYRILLYHGERSQLEKILERYPKFDLVFSSHSQILEFKNKVKPVIIGAGSDSEYLIRIVIRSFSRGQPVVKFEKIPIDLSITPSPEIRPLIEKFKKSSGK
ncbi:MAG: hypothetical protein GXO77_17020 [Calditrichaeota bacterium]|nr:hypothetical protein [Calditrichota bacterium]